MMEKRNFVTPIRTVESDSEELVGAASEMFRTSRDNVSEFEKKASKEDEITDSGN